MALFRARAQGGITPTEATRREEALRAFKDRPPGPFKVLPPPMPWPSAIATPPAHDDPQEQITPDTLDAEVAEAFANTDPHFIAVAGPGVITITISGPPHSGKSAMAHMIRATLAHYGTVFRGPDGLVSFHWRRSLDAAMRDGLSVEIVEKTDTPE